LGWEPQWLLIKNITSAYNWILIDNMRGLPISGNTPYFMANEDDAEANFSLAAATATGFKLLTSDCNVNCNTYIYIAIRRGPMKTPTDAATVFSPLTLNGTTGTKLTTGFPVDMQISAVRTVTDSTVNNVVSDRTRGISTNTSEVLRYLNTASTGIEITGPSGTSTRFWDNTGFQFPSFISGYSTTFLNFRRAPGFFDVVAYTGTGGTQNVTHNLGVTPELLIVKSIGRINNSIIITDDSGKTETFQHCFISPSA
jgi:hypothetical protein